jgi:hypothetical protein
LDTTAKEIQIDRLSGVESPNARPDLRAWTESGASQELSIRGEQVDGLTGGGVPVQAGNSAGENPRVAAQERFFSSGFEGKG